MFHRQMNATRPRHTLQVVNPYRIRMIHHFLSPMPRAAVKRSGSGVLKPGIDQVKEWVVRGGELFIDGHPR